MRKDTEKPIKMDGMDSIVKDYLEPGEWRPIGGSLVLGDLLLHLAAQLKGASDMIERLERTAGSANGHGSVMQHLPHEALVHRDAFHLLQENLLRAPFHEAHFQDDSLVGHGKFNGIPEQYRTQYHNRTERQKR
jgi:hypothetical protein